MLLLAINQAEGVLDLARIYEFSSILENTIRLVSATHWTPVEDYGFMFTANQPYLLEINEWTDEFYVQDDQQR